MYLWSCPPHSSEMSMQAPQAACSSLRVSRTPQEVAVLGAEPDVEVVLDLLAGVRTMDDAIGQPALLPCPGEAVDAKASTDGARTGPTRVGVTQPAPDRYCR